MEIMIQCPAASLEAIEFPTSWEYKVRMPSQLPDGWPFPRGRSETLFTKIVCLRRQSNIPWKRRADFYLGELTKWVQRRRPRQLGERIQYTHAGGRQQPPVHISNITQPTKLQMSILELYPFFLLLMTSGAIQKTDPCIELWALTTILMSSVRFEIPKLVILQSPNSSSTRMLSAFRS